MPSITTITPTREMRMTLWTVTQTVAIIQTMITSPQNRRQYLSRHDFTPQQFITTNLMETVIWGDICAWFTYEIPFINLYLNSKFSWSLQLDSPTRMEPWTSPWQMLSPQEVASTSPIQMGLQPNKQAHPMRTTTLQMHPGAMILTLIWTMTCRPMDTWSEFGIRRARRRSWPNFSAASLSQRLLSNTIIRAVRIKLPGAVSELVGTIKKGTENARVQIN